MLLEGTSFFVPVQSLAFLNVAFNFTAVVGKTPYGHVLHCEGENSKEGEWQYALIASNEERLSKKFSLSADILLISKNSLNESLGEILVFPRNVAHNFEKQPPSEEAKTTRAAKTSAKSASKILNEELTQPKQKDAFHSDSTAHADQTVDFPCAREKSLECMEIESRVLDALEQDPVLLNIDTHIREESLSETVRSDFVELFEQDSMEKTLIPPGH